MNTIQAKDSLRLDQMVDRILTEHFTEQTC
jgi:hypothetical protein